MNYTAAPSEHCWQTIHTEALILLLTWLSAMSAMENPIHREPKLPVLPRHNAFSAPTPRLHVVMIHSLPKGTSTSCRITRKKKLGLRIKDLCSDEAVLRTMVGPGGTPDRHLKLGPVLRNVNACNNHLLKPMSC